MRPRRANAPDNETYSGGGSKDLESCYWSIAVETTFHSKVSSVHRVRKGGTPAERIKESSSQPHWPQHSPRNLPACCTPNASSRHRLFFLIAKETDRKPIGSPGSGPIIPRRQDYQGYDACNRGSVAGTHRFQSFSPSGLSRSLCVGNDSVQGLRQQPLALAVRTIMHRRWRHRRDTFSEILG
ncbi:hypothetical protein BCR34DRAFT_584613 [Clohesyomyces aquaticus]|uniref:Uncharacterized protein n=1 Tax=Clohesyomyces aquaticus TaxID=1231657 RepID=A0A1Y2A1H7_9PLEO|nr:hypothetical protein BCR34DRAFT_584613 [Clohesyomyces aquaticus]